MLHKYDPMTGNTRLDLQNHVTYPSSRCSHLKDVPTAIEKWETEYRKYLMRAGRELDDEMRQNIILRMLPAKFEQTFRMNVQLAGRSTTHASLR